MFVLTTRGCVKVIFSVKLNINLSYPTINRCGRDRLLDRIFIDPYGADWFTLTYNSLWKASELILYISTLAK
jgi:hypothetical protein